MKPGIRVKRILRSVQPQVGMDVLVYIPAEWAEMSGRQSFVREEICNTGQVGYARAG